MKIKSLIKVLFAFHPEKFGYNGQCSKLEYWNKIEPLIHNEIEPNTFKIADDLESLKDWGEFYAEQVKYFLVD